MRLASTLTLLGLLLMVGSGHAATCRVTTAGTTAGDGSDWGAQAMDLQTALADNNCTEIWVTGGVYKPVTPVLPGSPTANERGVSFVIDRPLQLYGGLAGTESLLAERDLSADFTSVLSGDIGGDDTTGADQVVVNAADISGANSIHVVLIDGTTGTAIGTSTVVDGFVITAGQANTSAPGSWGGGLLCDGEGPDSECSPVLRNLTFSGNRADHGGAICNNGSYSGNSHPIIEDATFRGNLAVIGGGAMFNNGRSGNSSPHLLNLTFFQNAADFGGAVFNYAQSGKSSPTIESATFSGTTALTFGGAIANTSLAGESKPVILHSIVWGNAAPENPSIGNSPAYPDTTTHPDIIFSVIEGSGGSGASWDPNIGHNGGGNIDADPMLGPLQDNGGFNQTMAPSLEGPAFDSGYPRYCATQDQRGVPRPQGPSCDLGSVELLSPAMFADGFE